MTAPAPPADHVLVVGSINVDLVTRVPRLPAPGETVLGGAFTIVAGGKGANQAVAAARLGAPVRLVGRVGDDDFGRLALAAVGATGVHTAHVAVDTAATGTAQIVVDAQGQNAIAVSSGANARVSPGDVVAAEPAWIGARLVVTQLEVPLVTVETTVHMAAERRLPVILNAAPAQPLPAALLRNVTWLVLNEIEAEQLAGRTVRSVGDAIAAAAGLRAPAQRIVISLGATGAVLVHDGEPIHEPAPTVRVIDTTAAGDALVGALAAALQRGATDAEALRYAVAAGSLACTSAGAIPSMPSAEAVDALLELQASSSKPQARNS